jgi:hypothetical protein
MPPSPEEGFDGVAAAEKSPRLTIVRYAAPAFAALALLMVMAGDVADLNDDLHIFVPGELARSATQLPVRALRYTKLLDSQGPTLAAERIALQLRSSAGTRAGTLEPGPDGLLGLETNVALPELLAGEWIELIATSSSARPPLTARASIHVQEALDVVRPLGRAARGLQQFSPGPVRTEPGALAPDALAVRVRGGACVPEQRCRIVVWVGAPAASIRVQSNSTLTPLSAAETHAAETSGVVAFDVVTHGPEAELWLVAERAGQPVARRAVRLPIAMGGLNVEANRLVVEQTNELRVRSESVAQSCIVDAFRDGHWRATGTLRTCATLSALPFGLDSGLWRLQLRRDALSGEPVAVASFYRRSPGERDEQVAAAWARAALQSEPDDRFVRGCAAQPALCVEPSALEYLAATQEAGILPPPEAVTAYATRQQHAREQRARLRWLALCALGLGAIGLALSVSRSGLRAGVRASQLFSEDPGSARRARVRSVVMSAASALSLLLVFAVLALYVLARGGY